MKITKYELIAFISGACVMILEILGSRLIAPYLGSSIYVWSSLIGIVLLALSIGYYVGGKAADKYPKESKLAQVLLFSAISVAVIPIILEYIGPVGIGLGIKLGGILISFTLFFLPAFLLGIVSPYLIKLTTKELSKVGSSAGRIYAISTVGSIVGTFLAGFVLIPYMGTTNIVYLVAILLALCFLVLTKEKMKIFIIFLLIAISIGHSALIKKESGLLYEKDTEYYKIKVIDSDGIRYLFLDTQRASALELDSRELYFKSTKYSKLLKYLKEDAKEILFLGAGGCVEQSYLLKKLDVHIDSVEIDPEVFEVCKDYFYYEPSNKTNEIVEDGRVYLSKTNKKYDIIRVDVYNSQNQIPIHLSTLEAVGLIKEHLNENGIVFINIVGSLEGEKSEFFKSELKTYKEKFENAYVFAAYIEYPKEVQNILVFFSDSKLDFEKAFENPETNEFKEKYYDKEIEGGIVLTDEYAPVDTMIAKYYN